MSKRSKKRRRLLRQMRRRPRIMFDLETQTIPPGAHTVQIQAASYDARGHLILKAAKVLP